MDVNKIIQGDCLEVMRTMPDNSVDSIVTDPPYGLSFMGKHWDYDVPTVEVWRECLRVLKPGGHLLSFAGTRTYHRMAVNIEDAGFEIRDMIAWIYGSGFPKSLDVSKAIDKNNGTYCRGEKSPNSRDSGESPSGCYSVGVQNKTLPNPQSDMAKQWQGWGTALKPALEPICVARKPLIGTVAENVLQYGTGGINVDGCRLDAPGRKTGTVNPEAQNGSGNCYLGSDGKKQMEYDLQNLGRFPANLIHDGSEEVLAGFPDVGSGNNGLPYNYRGKEYDNKNNSMFNGDKPQANSNFNDSGSAARFFYCAKSSKQDRDEGCEGLITVERGLMDDDNYQWREDVPNGRSTNKPTGKNNHPTVKPTDLMRYLCRLVTPPNGIILDPFFGSGSTGKAAKLEYFNYIGIEREPEYCEIAQKRIDGTIVNKKLNFGGEGD